MRAEVEFATMLQPRGPLADRMTKEIALPDLESLVG